LTLLSESLPSEKLASKQPPSKILIVLLGAIGDVVRALPLATRIKQNWPETQIHWAIEPRSKGILLEHSSIDKLVTFDRPKGLAAFREFLKQVKSEDYDLVLDLQRHFKSGVISCSTKASRRVGFHRKGSREFNWLFNTETIPPVEKFSPKIEQFQLFGDNLKLPRGEALDFGFEEHLSDKEKITELSKGFDLSSSVALILGSSWPSRFWIEDYYVELIETLRRDYSLGVVLVGGPSESEYASRIYEKRVSNTSPSDPILNLVAKTNLRELTELFSRVRFAIGSDSGPMHIASAVDCQIISLWGSTSSMRSAPYGSEKLVIDANVPCAPCYRKNCPGLGMQCMKSIKPEVVIEKIQQASLLGR